MWKNFSDVRSMAEKISKVVAPPGADDDDESEDEEEYYEEEEEVRSKGMGISSPFGIVSMLARAMDQEQQQYHQSAGDEGDDEHLDFDGDGNNKRRGSAHSSAASEEGEFVQAAAAAGTVIGMSSPEDTFTPHVSPPKPDEGLQRSAVTDWPASGAPVEAVQEDIFRNEPHGSNSNNNSNDAADAAVPSDRPILHQNSSIGSSVMLSESEEPLEPIRVSSSFTTKIEHQASSRKIIDGSAEGIHDNSHSVPEAFHDSFSAHAEEPRFMGLVRESGSLSPQRKQSGGNPSHGRRSDSNTPNLSPRSLGSTPSGVQISLSPLKDILAKKAASWDLDGSDHHVDDALLGTMKTDLNARYPQEELADVPYTAGNSGILRAVLESMPPLDAMDEGEDEDEEPNGRSHSNPIVSKQHTSTPTANGNCTGSNEQARRIEKLEKRCKELMKQLKSAETLNSNLQQHPQSLQQKDDREVLMQQFQEKEARLLQAAAEDHEQDMISLRNDFDEEITVMQKQLIEERNTFQKDREHLNMLLNDATHRADRLERRAVEERNETERSVSNAQQQQARALRLAEDKLAQTLAVLEEREETILHLQSTVQSIESRISEHHEGVQEAEEEMDELHAENEELHNHVETLQAECAELRSKAAKMEGDADKLVHLKVSS
jgi:hypothetical protein